MAGIVAPRGRGQIAWMRQLDRDRYSDFTAKHFHEVLRRQHNYTLCYTVTRLALQSPGLVTKAVRRSAHRKKQQRRPLPGMLLFQDGSTHRWPPASETRQDLIVTLDDATGAIYSMFLIEEEGTRSSFMGLSEVIARHGLFSAFYTDRDLHYFFTQKAGGKVDKLRLSQVGRAHPSPVRPQILIAAVVGGGHQAVDAGHGGFDLGPGDLLKQGASPFRNRQLVIFVGHDMHAHICPTNSRSAASRWKWRASCSSFGSPA